MTRHQRILAWVRADAQRMKDEATLTKVAAWITGTPRPHLDVAKVYAAVQAHVAAYGTAGNPSFSQRMGFVPFPK